MRAIWSWNRKVRDYLLNWIWTFGIPNGCCICRSSTEAVIGIAYYRKAV